MLKSLGLPKHGGKGESRGHDNSMQTENAIVNAKPVVAVVYHYIFSASSKLRKMELFELKHPLRICFSSLIFFGKTI